MVIMRSGHLVSLLETIYIHDVVVKMAPGGVRENDSRM